jgi:hypothetical protein
MNSNESAGVSPARHELTREQLFDLIWLKPLTTIAADLGISDVALLKRCRKLNLPTPRRGYWAKVAAGIPVRKRPKLPAMSGGQESAAHHARWPRDVLGLCDRAQSFIRELTLLKPNYREMLSLQHSVYPHTEVSKKVIEPAGRLFHAILVAVESSGVPFRKSRSKYEGGYFEKGYDRLYLRFEEPLVEIPGQPSWSSVKRNGTGKIQVTLKAQTYGGGWQKTWTEANVGKRELVNSVARAVLDYYVELEKQREVEKEKRRREHERWLIDEDRRTRAEHAAAVTNANAARVRDMLLAAEWARLHRVAMEFVNECETRWLLSGGSLSLDQQNWLRWARTEADAWSPWATGYPDPAIDGVFDIEKFPYPEPPPAIREFPRPPSLPKIPAQETTSWMGPSKVLQPFWLRKPR